MEAENVNGSVPEGTAENVNGPVPEGTAENGRTIIVCLSRDRTPFSWFAYFTDGGGLTHASIAFDEDEEYYYSFNFKGFKREYRTSLKRRQREMKRYRISVTEEQYRALKRIITAMEAKKGSYRYAGVGVSLCLFKIPNNSENDERLFCSQFVAKVLDESGCVKMTKSVGNITPNMLGEQIENSGKLIDITDDSTMRPLGSKAIDSAVKRLEEGKDVVVDFSIRRLMNRPEDKRFGKLLLRVGVGTADKCETVYRSVVTLSDKVKTLSDSLPALLAEQTGKLIAYASEQLEKVIRKVIG